MQRTPLLLALCVPAAAASAVALWVLSAGWASGASLVAVFPLSSGALALFAALHTLAPLRDGGRRGGGPVRVGAAAGFAGQMLLLLCALALEVASKADSQASAIGLVSLAAAGCVIGAPLAVSGAVVSFLGLVIERPTRILRRVSLPALRRNG